MHSTFGQSHRQPERQRADPEHVVIVTVEFEIGITDQDAFDSATHSRDLTDEGIATRMVQSAIRTARLNNPAMLAGSIKDVHHKNR